MILLADFADFDYAGIAALVVGLLGGGGIGGLIGWWVKHRMAENKNRARRNKTSVNEYQDLLDQERAARVQEHDARLESDERCVQRVNRLQGQVDDQQRAIHRLFILYVDAGGTRLRDYDLIIFFKAGWERANERLSSAGISTERIPEAPPAPLRDREAEAEFIRNQSQQNTTLVAEADKVGL